MKTINKNSINSSIIYNPFNLGGPARGEDFYNRKEILQSIQTFIYSSPHETHLLVTGQRRIGKTSLLRRIQDITEDSIHAVYYDLQDKAQYLSRSEFLDYGLMYSAEKSA